MRGICDPAGKGWLAACRHTKPSRASTLLDVGRARVCTMHPFLFYVCSVRVSASYLLVAPFLAFVLFCFVLFYFVFGSFIFVVFALFCFMLSLELCRSSSDLFLPNKPRAGLATAYS